MKIKEFLNEPKLAHIYVLTHANHDVSSSEIFGPVFTSFELACEHLRQEVAGQTGKTAELKQEGNGYHLLEEYEPDGEFYSFSLSGINLDEEYKVERMVLYTQDICDILLQQPFVKTMLEEENGNNEQN